MRRGVDTNVLIYAQLSQFPQHSKVRNYLLQQLGDEANTLFVTPSVLHEFVHIVTDARRFEAPLTMSSALSVARNLLDRSNVICLSTDTSAVQQAFNLLERHRLGRKRIADTLLAATLMRHGVPELITCNGRDFKSFDGLRPVDPRTTA